MSKEAKIQEKLWKAYGKVGKVLGRDFGIYRSAELDTPIKERKWVVDLKVAFSQDWKYSQTLKTGVSLWKCWVDGRYHGLADIQQGDILYNSTSGETYFIASTQRHLDIQAIKANDRITINRSGYSDSANGFGPGDTEVAANVPCYIEELSGTGGGLGYVPGGNYGTDALPQYRLYLWDPNEEIEARDAIVDDQGRRFQVLNIDRNEIGTILYCKVYTP